MDSGAARGRARGLRGNDKGRRPGGANENGNGNDNFYGNGYALAAGMAGLNIGESERGIGRGASRGTRTRKEIDFANYDLVNTRPAELVSKQGTSGTFIDLRANYFVFKKKPDYKLFQYRVDLSLEEDRTFVKRAIVKRVSNVLPIFLFDGTVMVTTEELYPHLQKQDRRIMSTRTNEGQPDEPCEIVLKLVGEIHRTDHHYIHFFNALLRRAMEGLKLQLLGRNYYDAAAAKMEPAWRLEIWPGYVTSIRQHELEVLTCAEVSHKVLRTDSVLDQIRQLKQELSRRPGGAGELMNLITRNLIGVIVITKYNRKSYRIDDIDWSQTPESTFPKKDGTLQSFGNYYETRYGIRVTDLQQPLLVSMPKEKDRRGGKNEPVLLVPELCTLTGLDDKMRSNYKLMEEMAKYTRMKPVSRVESLLSLSRRLNDSPESKKALKDWGMEIDTQLVKLKGRVLSPEDILLKGSQVFKYNIEDADWSRGIRKGLYAAVPITKFIVIYPKEHYQNVDSFHQNMMKAASNGQLVELGPPKWEEILDTRTGTYIRKVRECVEMKPNMIVVVIPNDKGDTYASIKKLLCCECPVPSQILTVQKVIGKPQKHMTFATKVLMQMTAKLGGEPWALSIPLNDLMVVGFDTYHDTANKGQSFGALVATLNKNCSRYFSACSPHVPNAEMSSQIPVLFMQAVRKYQEVNKGLPKRIIFYRDGVGEGQVQQVVDHELKNIQHQFASIPAEQRPKLTFIIVSKRINTRFFAEKNKTASNPPSGTIVDDVITLPERFDFFLISQSVKQGTVNPTSYNVIFDQSGLKPEHIQKLTYKLCHLYYNWTGTVRVPAPCQYAHKLAYLCGESLLNVPSSHLDTLLYFL